MIIKSSSNHLNHNQMSDYQMWSSESYDKIIDGGDHLHLIMKVPPPPWAGLGHCTPIELKSSIFPKYGKL
jgi:hypothetical protein